jgi:hypothetical protein
VPRSIGLRQGLGPTLAGGTEGPGDLHGYVSFFLLDDFVTEDFGVKLVMAYDDFRPPSVPKISEATRGYRRRSIKFIEARNHRIQ